MANARTQKVGLTALALLILTGSAGAYPGIGDFGDTELV
jgi:hypothetical protein